MSSFSRAFVVACAGALVVAAACGDDEATPPPGGAGGADGGTGGAGGLGPTIQIHVTVEDGVNMALLENVEICVLDTPLPCVHTDVEGKVDVTVPAGRALWATLTKADYVNALVGAVTGDEDLTLTAPLVTRALAEVVAGAVVTPDATKGNVAMIAIGHPPAGETSYPPQEGVTFALDPASGSGPHYVNQLNVIDFELTATGPERGGALWFNLDPADDIVLTVTHPSEDCVDFLAHPANDPNTFFVKVLPDFVTYVTVICGDPPMGMGGAGGMGGEGGMGGPGGMGGAGGMGGGGVGGAGGMGGGG
jgi:hypothetical protein